MGRPTRSAATATLRRAAGRGATLRETTDAPEVRTMVPVNGRAVLLAMLSAIALLLGVRGGVRRVGRARQGECGLVACAGGDKALRKLARANACDCRNPARH